MSNGHKKELRKQGFLQGAAVLTIGALVAKVIGAMFKIPLNRMIGTEGAGHFSVAYNIYTVLLNVSSTGLPIAVSRMISEANTNGQHRQMQRIHRISLMLFLLLGGLCGGAMFVFAPQLAAWMRDPDAVYAIMALAPAVLFVCICSAFRGYFQGQQYMTPTATAQVLEALSKLFIGLAAVSLALRAGWGYPQAAGASILGVTIGSVFGAIYFSFQYRSRRIRLTPEQMQQPVQPVFDTCKRILALAIPITIGATGIQIFNTLGGKIILGRLQDVHGYSLEAASSLYGIYSMAQTIYLLPSAFVQPLTVSIIPAVTEALTLNRLDDAAGKEESALRIASLIAMPCGAGLFVLSRPIQAFLYNYDGTVLDTAGPTLAILGIGSVFYCLVLITNAVLQAHGKVSVPIFTTAAAGVANLLTAYILVGMPQVQIHGAAAGTLVHCVTAFALNSAAICRLLPEPPKILRQLVKPFVAAAVMGAAAAIVYSILPNLFLSMGVAVVVYAGMILALRVLTWYDCQLLPKGSLIAKLLRIPNPNVQEDH